MESDLTDLDDLDPNNDFDREKFLNNVKKIMSIRYFNRIKQFMIRLCRNNLYLGHNYENKNNISPSIMLNCNTTSKLVQLMIRILKKAGCLSNGCKLDMFLYERYPIDTLEKITLKFTWKFKLKRSLFDNKLQTTGCFCEVGRMYQ